MRRIAEPRCHGIIVVIDDQQIGLVDSSMLLPPLNCLTVDGSRGPHPAAKRRPEAGRSTGAADSRNSNLLTMQATCRRPTCIERSEILVDRPNAAVAVPEQICGFSLQELCVNPHTLAFAKASGRLRAGTDQVPREMPRLDLR